MTAPRRRWSFGLRMLFLVVAVAAIGCGWLRWQLQIVTARKSLLAELEKGSPESSWAVDDHGVVASQVLDEYREKYPDKSFSIPWYRQWLGDKPMLVLFVPHEKEALAAALFPEACLEDPSNR